MDIPAIQVVKSGDTHENDTLLMSEARELYLRLKGVGKDKVFKRTANRNTGYVMKLLGDRDIYSRKPSHIFNGVYFFGFSILRFQI